MSYFFKLFIFSFFVFIGVYYWNKLLPVEYTTANAYYIVLFFAIFSFLTHLALINSLSSQNKNDFSYRFMAASGIKMILSLFIILIYGFLRKKEIVSFAILFLLNYFLFTGFELFLLLRQLKNPNNHPQS